MTLRRALGLAEHLNSPFNISEYSEYPMAKSYIKLVKTVEPFENYFTEPGLLGQSFLRAQYSIFMTVLYCTLTPQHSPRSITFGLSFATPCIWRCSAINNAVCRFSLSWKWTQNQHLDLRHLQLPIRHSNSPPCLRNIVA